METKSTSTGEKAVSSETSKSTTNEKITVVSETEKYDSIVKETNAGMDKVLELRRDLEDSHRKQEVLISKITKLDEENKKAISKLAEKAEGKRREEIEKFKVITAELDIKRKELEDSRAKIPTNKSGVLLPDSIKSKVDFINSVIDSDLVKNMNSQTLIYNANQHIVKIAEMESKDILEYDPINTLEYEQVGAMLNKDYGWGGVPATGGFSYLASSFTFKSPLDAAKSVVSVQAFNKLGQIKVDILFTGVEKTKGFIDYIQIKPITSTEQVDYLAISVDGMEVGQVIPALVAVTK